MAAHGERLPKKVESLGSGQRAGSRADKAQAVAELRQQFPIVRLLKVAGLSRSTFYYQCQLREAGDRYAVLKRQIQRLYERHKGCYGYRRLTAALRQAGIQVNHKTVQRLMQQQGLKALVRVKKYRSYRGAVGRTAPNLLERRFEAAAMYQKWATDITEFNVAGQKLYLSPVMDLHNGEIIAFETAVRPSFDLVATMLRKALAKLPAGARPLVHSDQGWHYQMSAYQRLLRERQLEQSMSRKGNCLDNAAMESFFGTLKSEFFYLNKFAGLDELKAGLKRYIRYYNHERIKLKLNGLSPVQYRTQPIGP
jgi:putative transposase